MKTGGIPTALRGHGWTSSVTKDSFRSMPFPVAALVKMLGKLRDDVVNDVSGDIGETEIATGVTVGEPEVIQTEQVQHRGV